MQTPVPPEKRIIVALDVPTVKEALLLVGELTPFVGFFKIGFQLIYSMLAELIMLGEDESKERLHQVRNLFDMLKGKVFLDVKLKDIPNTVAGASEALTKLGVSMFNLHCLGGSAMMKAAVESVRKTAVTLNLAEPPKLFGVTLLTSLDYPALVELGIWEELNISNPEELARIQKERKDDLAVHHLAWLAQECGLDGVIASAQEAQAIREYCGADLLIATPGIRPAWAEVGDQKRVLNPRDAILAGADYLVIGRPILKPPAEIGDRVKAAQLIAAEIAEASTKQEKGGLP